MHSKKIIAIVFSLVVIVFSSVGYYVYSMFVPQKSAIPELPLSDLKKATIVASCAPWDGEAIFISTEKEGKQLGVSLFAQGLDRFRAGKNVSITKSGDSTTGIGVANLCDMGTSPQCKVYEAGRVEIKNLGRYSENENLLLEIFIDGEKIPIEATWDTSVKPICG